MRCGGPRGLPAFFTFLLLAGFVSLARAQTPPPPASPPVPTVSCSSHPGARNQCPADTTKGIVLLRSSGEAPCLLGKTWGYDQSTVWVSDGCSGEFSTGSATAADTAKAAPPRHIPNVGFLVFDGDKGQIYLRLFSYARYLNQRALDESYVDAFGNSH